MYMKMITLPKLRDALRDMKYEVRVPAEVAAGARADRAHGRDRLRRPPRRRARSEPARARFLDCLTVVHYIPVAPMWGEAGHRHIRSGIGRRDGHGVTRELPKP